MASSAQERFVSIRQVGTDNGKPINLEVVVTDGEGRDLSGFERHLERGELSILKGLGVIRRVDGLPDFSFTQKDLDDLPPIGSKVWAIKHHPGGNKEPLHVTVDGYDVRDGKLVLVIEFYWVPTEEAFKTREEAEKYLTLNLAHA